MTHRFAAMVINGRQEKMREISTGIPQGSPISPLLFLLYTTPLYKIIEDQGFETAGYIDDITIYCHGKPAENANRLSQILKECEKWTKDHHTAIDMGDKLGFIHFDKSSNFPLTLPNGEQRAPQESVRLLGIELDRGLTFHQHIAGVEKKMKLAALLAWKLGGESNGVRGAAARQIYLACVRPMVEYGIEIWYSKTTQLQRKLMQVTQNRAIRQALGAVKTTPIEVMQKEIGIAPMDIRAEQLLLYRILRLFGNLNPNNPLGKSVRISAEAIESPLYKLKCKVDQTDIPMPRNMWELRRKPPWEAPRPRGNPKKQSKKNTQMEQQTSKAMAPTVIESRKAADKIAIRDWQARYDNTSRGQTYKQLIGTSLCSTVVEELQLNFGLRNWSRRILSTIVQFRSGHARVGAWRQRFNISGQITCETCDCLQTTQHILLECSSTEEHRRILRVASPTLNEKDLLCTHEGLQAVSDFLLKSGWKG
jgi:hypothetical protein